MKHSYLTEENLLDQFLVIWNSIKGDLPAAVNIVFVQSIRKGEISQIIGLCDFDTASEIVDRLSCHLKKKGGGRIQKP